MLIALLVAASVQDCSTLTAQADLNACAYREFETADRALNAQWKITLAAMRATERADGRDSFGPPTTTVLLDSQRAWLAYRDAECALQGESLRGGSAQPMEIAGCKVTLTEARTKALKQLIEQR